MLRRRPVNDKTWILTCLCAGIWACSAAEPEGEADVSFDGAQVQTATQKPQDLPPPPLTVAGASVSVHPDFYDSYSMEVSNVGVPSEVFGLLDDDSMLIGEQVLRVDVSPLLESISEDLPHPYHVSFDVQESLDLSRVRCLVIKEEVDSDSEQKRTVHYVVEATKVLSLANTAVFSSKEIKADFVLIYLAGYREIGDGVSVSRTHIQTGGRVDLAVDEGLLLAGDRVNVVRLDVSQEIEDGDDDLEGDSEEIIVLTSEDSANLLYRIYDPSLREFFEYGDNTLTFKAINPDVANIVYDFSLTLSDFSLFSTLPLLPAGASDASSDDLAVDSSRLDAAWLSSFHQPVASGLGTYLQTDLGPILYDSR